MSRRSSNATQAEGHGYKPLGTKRRAASKSAQHKRDSRRAGLRRGSAMLEFALTMPLLILVVAGVFQFGYTLFLYNELQGAVRGGARYASLADYDSPAGDVFRQAVKNFVVYGKTSPVPGTDLPLAPGLTTANIAVDDTEKDGTGIPLRVTVAVQNYSIPAVWTDFTFNNKPRSTFVYLGQVK